MLQQVHDIAEPHGEKFSGFLQDLLRQRIAGKIGLAYHFTGDVWETALGSVENSGVAAGSDLFGGAAGDSGAGRQRFDAAKLAASAAGAAIVNRHVATLGGGTGAAVIDAAIEHNPGSDARADGGAKDISIAAARPPQSFR